jgi:hypothetical protein
MNPSRRERCDERVASNLLNALCASSSANVHHTVPSGTDDAQPVPRHFMPGYYQLVPPGHRLYADPVFQQSARLKSPSGSGLTLHLDVSDLSGPS